MVVAVVVLVPCAKVIESLSGVAPASEPVVNVMPFLDSPFTEPDKINKSVAPAPGSCQSTGKSVIAFIWAPKLSTKFSTLLPLSKYHTLADG